MGLGGPRGDVGLGLGGGRGHGRRSGRRGTGPKGSDGDVLHEEQEHTGCRQVKGQKHAGCRMMEGGAYGVLTGGEEQKHTRVPNRSTECRTDSWRGCRDKMSRAKQAAGEGTHTRLSLRADPRRLQRQDVACKTGGAHTRDCHSGLTSGVHTRPAYHTAT